MNIKGLDEFQRNLSQLQRALSELDGELGTVRFDPSDPVSIEAAIAEMERTIDERIASFRGNDVVDGIVEQMKEHYREAILDRAAEARQEGMNDE